MEQSNTKTKKERSNFRMTVAWKNFRARLIEDRGAVCECCGTRYYGKQKRGLQIHHLDTDNYEYLLPERFKILCSACHEALVERMSTKIIGKKSTDIPNLEIWVKLLYEVLPYKTRRALKEKHDTYLTENLSDWAFWKERDKDIFNDTLPPPEIEEGILIDTEEAPKKSRSRKAKKEKKVHKQGGRPITKEPRRKKNDERLLLSQLR